MKIRLYKTGDPCPCCGRPIKWTDPEDLKMFSLLCHVAGLVDENIPEVEIGDPFPEVVP